MNSEITNIYWVMGPTSSGKTTISERFVKELRCLNIPVIHFDGDEVRDFFGEAIGFSNEDRLRVVKTLVHLANKSLDAGLNVVVSALTAYDDAREYVDDNIHRLVQVYIKCDIKTCRLRDPKGLYLEAIKGNIDTLAGFNDKYIPPPKPDLTIDTNLNSLESCVEQLMTFPAA